ncbi:hypothetical protein BGP_6370 [Beggiatoa sp. PS]|nr:hypothetical protein BGP_6370 [Beggiatoa sp. PS]
MGKFGGQVVTIFHWKVFAGRFFSEVAVVSEVSKEEWLLEELK